MGARRVAETPSPLEGEELEAGALDGIGPTDGDGTDELARLALVELEGDGADGEPLDRSKTP
jgi:hypothetical protein